MTASGAHQLIRRPGHRPTYTHGNQTAEIPVEPGARFDLIVHYSRCPPIAVRVRRKIVAPDKLVTQNLRGFAQQPVAAPIAVRRNATEFVDGFVAIQADDRRVVTDV